MNPGLFKEETVQKLIADFDWTWLEYNLGGWNVGEQAEQRLGPKEVDRRSCSACTSVNRLYIKNAD